jgi:UDP:flavonoid glycosyltransferase YjiC (YdhE family)
MTPVLFVTWDGGGNVPPALATAAVLQGRGHPVRVLGHPQQRAAVEAVGLRFEPFTHAGPWVAAAPVGGRKSILGVFVDRGIAQDVTDALDRTPGGVAVVDCMLLSALDAAARAGVPRVALVHTLYEFVVDRWGGSLVGQMAAERGLAPRPLWQASARMLVASPADLAGPGRWPANVRFTGPVWVGGRPAQPYRSAEPRILVSLSSVFFEGQQAIVQSVMEAVADVPAEVILTTGYGLAPDDVRVPGNVTVHRFLPHAEVMPAVSLVVGHGGHSTAMHALAHDLPLVVVPVFPYGDQPAVGAAVQRAGAGLALDSAAPPAEIREAIVAMLADGPHRKAAAELGARLRARDGAAVAADEILDLAVSQPA